MRFGEKVGMQKPPFPLAAMIDIMFLLLLFFMMTSLYAEMEAELNIALPVSKEATEIKRETTEIIINVKADGTYVVNQISHDLPAMDEKLRQMAEANRQANREMDHIIIRGDKDAKYDYVITLLDLCRKHNIWNVSFAVRKEEAAATGTP